MKNEIFSGQIQSVQEQLKNAMPAAGISWRDAAAPLGYKDRTVAFRAFQSDTTSIADTLKMMALCKVKTLQVSSPAKLQITLTVLYPPSFDFLIQQMRDRRTLDQNAEVETILGDQLGRFFKQIDLLIEEIRKAPIEEGQGRTSPQFKGGKSFQDLADLVGISTRTTTRSHWYDYQTRLSMLLAVMHLIETTELKAEIEGASVVFSIK